MVRVARRGHVLEASESALPLAVYVDVLEVWGHLLAQLTLRGWGGEAKVGTSVYLLVTLGLEFALIDFQLFLVFLNAYMDAVH